MCLEVYDEVSVVFIFMNVVQVLLESCPKCMTCFTDVEFVSECASDSINRIWSVKVQGGDEGRTVGVYVSDEDWAVVFLGGGALK